MFCELFSSFARIHARFMKDSGRPRYMLANEVLMRVHGVLCSPYEFYARHPDFMLTIRDLCSPSRFYARHTRFMLATISHKTKNTAGATLQCSHHPLDEANAS